MAHSKKNTIHQILVPMVDSTDFASIESGITESDFNSGITKKFYGWNTGVSTATTSGTLSKTASLVRSGVFRITVKATENNYDFVMARFNKTGCAEQIFTWSNVDNDDSDLLSALTVIQSMASDAASAATQANSRVLLNQSRISDIASVLSNLDSDFQSRVPKAVATNSQLSDLISDLGSDLRSLIVVGVKVADSDMSDIRSAIAAGPAATVTASDISDIASAVYALMASNLSDILSAAVQTNSRVLVGQSYLSDIRSHVSDLQSDFQSRVPKAVATNSQLSDLGSDLLSYLVGMSSMDSNIYSLLSDVNSDLRSLIVTTGVNLNTSVMSDLRSAMAAGPAATITASDISDIASAVWANTIGARVDSRVVLNLSRISDLQSLSSDIRSDLRSMMSSAGPTVSDIASAVAVELASDLSDIKSAAVQANSRVLLVQSIVSDVRSHVSDLQSDFQSRVPKAVATNSQLSDLASDIKSVLTVNQSAVSDLFSQLSDFRSDIGSLLGTTGVQLNASMLSDLRSAIAAGPTGAVTASDISDIVSATLVGLASNLSDILSAAVQANSRVLVNQSYLSDIRSHVSDLQSDFQSRVPKRVATDSQLSDLSSDLKSAITVAQSMASDAASAAQQANSRVLLNQSAISDVYSLLGTVGVSVSAISDIASAVTAALASDLSDIKSATTQINSRALVNQSVVSDVYSLLSDLRSDFQSRVPKAVATNSQLSDLASDIASAVHVNSLVLDQVYSNLTVGVKVGPSSLSDITSATWAFAGAEPTGVVAHAGSMKSKLDWLAALARNKITQTSSKQSLRNDADNATLASALVSDDGSTAVRGEFA